MAATTRALFAPPEYIAGTNVPETQLRPLTNLRQKCGLSLAPGSHIDVMNVTEAFCRYSRALPFQSVWTVTTSCDRGHRFWFVTRSIIRSVNNDV